MLPFLPAFSIVGFCRAEGWLRIPWPILLGRKLCEDVRLLPTWVTCFDERDSLRPPFLC